MIRNPSSAGPDQARLILVVGPSGAGKDALIERSRLAFSGDPRFVFARRVVTRPAAAEDHDTLDERALAAFFLPMFKGEDDGYLAVYAFDQEKRTSELVLLDAAVHPRCGRPLGRVR